MAVAKAVEDGTWMKWMDGGRGGRGGGHSHGCSVVQGYRVEDQQRHGT